MQWQSQTIQPEVVCFYSHDVFHCFGFNENGDWIQLGNLQPFDGITRNIKNAVFTLKSEREGEMTLSKVELRGMQSITYKYLQWSLQHQSICTNDTIISPLQHEVPPCFSLEIVHHLRCSWPFFLPFSTRGGSPIIHRPLEVARDLKILSSPISPQGQDHIK